MRKTRRLLALGLIVIASVVLAALLGDVLGGLTGVRSFEDFTLDLRQHTTPESFQAGRGERESEIVLVLFDELSFYESPWLAPFPRAHLAELIDAVGSAGASTIGVDVYLDLLFERLNDIDGGNDLLRDAIERAGNVVLVSPVQQTDSGYVTAPPHPFFAEAAADVGTAELPASFETFRDATLAVRSGQGLEPSFALAMYAHARGLDVDSLLADAWDQGRVDLPGLPPGVGRIPETWRSDDGGSVNPIVPFRVLYSGPPSGTMDSDPPGTFQTVGSSNAALLATFSPETFEDKIVILGTGFHAEDRFRTPFYGYVAPAREGGGEGGTYGWMYGVELHANSLQNIIDEAYVRPLGTAGKLALLFAMAALAGSTVFWRGAGWGAVATVMALLGAWAVAFWVWAGVAYVPGAELLRFGTVGAWVPLGTTNLAALLSYVGSVAYVAIVEGREKRFIKGAFGKYLSPDVVAEIADDPTSLALGGEKRPLTLLFSDLSGFTTISEDMDAQDLIALLNEYLNEMTQVVFDELGYLDKYIGDAIMAFWNAPKEVPDHPDRGVRTAILMQRRLKALNERWRVDRPDQEPLKVRIGVHSGEVVVGNVGGEDRFDYSAIGDAVNVAARLEPANKTYDTLNMVSAVTLAATKQGYRVRELDHITVVGKDEPIKVYELLEMEGVELDPEKEAALERYAKGMESYRRHDWGEAKRSFEAALEACPQDGPSALYVSRCEENIIDPPPSDWDFVVRRTEK
jgi:class 3 adenylate cyclase/CHASE2 domain-containing sensor protein